MKLIFCPECTDIRKLHKDGVKCWCGKSWGKYLEDNHKAEIGGLAVPIGVDNDCFVRAYRARNNWDVTLANQKSFPAFFFHKDAESIKRIE
jgi:hypothetical protein